MEWQLIVFGIVVLFLLGLVVKMAWDLVAFVFSIRKQKKEMNIHQWKARRADPKGVLQAGKPAIGQRATTIEIPNSPWKTVPLIVGEQRLPRGSFVGVWINQKHAGKSDKEIWDLIQEHRTLMIDDERTPFDIEGYRDLDCIVLATDCARGRGFHSFIGEPKGLLLDHFLKGMDTIGDYLDWLEKNARFDPDDFWHNAHSADKEWAMKDYRRVALLVQKLENESAAKTTAG
jgi:hypothetical protein